MYRSTDSGNTWTPVPRLRDVTLRRLRRRPRRSCARRRRQHHLDDDRRRRDLDGRCVLALTDVSPAGPKALCSHTTSGRITAMRKLIVGVAVAAAVSTGVAGAATSPAGAAAPVPSCKGALIAVQPQPPAGRHGPRQRRRHRSATSASTPAACAATPVSTRSGATANVLAHARRTLNGFTGGAHAVRTIVLQSWQLASSDVEWMNFTANGHGVPVLEVDRDDAAEHLQDFSPPGVSQCLQSAGSPGSTGVVRERLTPTRSTSGRADCASRPGVDLCPGLDVVQLNAAAFPRWASVRTRESEDRRGNAAAFPRWASVRTRESEDRRGNGSSHARKAACHDETDPR